MSFLVTPKSPKVGKKVEKIGLASFKVKKTVKYFFPLEYIFMLTFITILFFWELITAQNKIIKTHFCTTKQNTALYVETKSKKNKEFQRSACTHKPKYKLTSK